MNYKNDYFEDPFDREFSRRFREESEPAPKKDVKKLLKDFAISFLFGCDVPSDLREDIYQYIDSRYNKIGACILWNKSNKFIEILQKYGLDIGSKEVILTSTAVLTTNDMRIAPKTALEI